MNYDGQTEKFKLQCVGESRDHRTNLWRATCKKCGSKHNPPTTMFRWQQIECPKCGIKENVDYNNIPE